MIDRSAFDALGPWVTRWQLDGHELGGDYDAAGDARLCLFGDTFGPLGRVLELGALEGGHTFALARRAASVLALEGRSRNLAKCRFMQQALDVRNVEFRLADLECEDLTWLGRFDAVFCVGLLYHLVQPWRLLRQCRAVSDRLFLWTHVADGDEGWARLYREGGPEDARSGLSEWSLWLTRPTLRALLKEAGWNRVEELTFDPRDPPAVTLAAWAD